jgi:hypothetical protein
MKFGIDVTPLHSATTLNVEFPTVFKTHTADARVGEMGSAIASLTALTRATA